MAGATEPHGYQASRLEADRPQAAPESAQAMSGRPRRIAAHARREETRVRELRAAEAIALEYARSGHASPQKVVAFRKLRNERLELDSVIGSEQ